MASHLPLQFGFNDGMTGRDVFHFYYSFPTKLPELLEPDSVSVSKLCNWTIVWV